MLVLSKNYGLNKILGEYKMIEKLIEISNYATFNSLKFTNGNNSDWDGNFKKNTIIYAPNGTGKTSLSLIFQAIKENDSNLIDKKRRISSDGSPKISILSDGTHIQFDNGTWSQKNHLDIEVFNSFYFEKNVYTFNLDDTFNKFIIENDPKLKEEVEHLTIKRKELIKLRRRAKFNRRFIKLAKQDKTKAIELATKLNTTLNLKSRMTENEQLNKRIDKKSSDFDKLYQKFMSNSHLISEQFREYCQKINDILSLFNDRIIINEIKPIYSKGGHSELSPTLIYTLSIDGKNTTLQDRNEVSFDYYLSDGDKSAIALASFLAKIEIMKNFDKKIIIIDDPFTSFDSGRKQRTIDLLAKLSCKVSQFILLTHDIDFGEKISHRIYPKKDLLTLQMFNHCNSTNIKTINFSREMLMGLMKNISLLHDFSKSGADNEAELNNVYSALRLSLEGVFKIKFFEFNSPNTWLGTYLEYIEHSEDEDKYKKFRRLVPYLQELRDIANYSNSAHHDESVFGNRNMINQSELKSYVKEALELIDII